MTDEDKIRNNIPLAGGGQGIPTETDRNEVGPEDVEVDHSQEGEAVVAYACDECEAAMELNFLDDHETVVGRVALEQCPLCQGTKLSPLTQAEYDAVYQDDGSDEFDPSQRERI